MVEKTKQVIAESMDFVRQCGDFKLCGGGCFARWYGFEDKSAYGAECSMKREAIKTHTKVKKRQRRVLNKVFRFADVSLLINNASGNASDI